MRNEKNLRIKCISPLFFPHPNSLEKILWLRVAKLVTDFSARSLNICYNFIKYRLFFLSIFFSTEASHFSRIQKLLTFFSVKLFLGFVCQL